VSVDHAIALDDASVERVARRVVELLDERKPATAELVDARTVAAVTGLDLKTVYRRKAHLGAVKVGRALRFDLAKALAGASVQEGDRYASERSDAPSGPAKPRRKRQRKRAATPSHCQLLPVGRVGDRPHGGARP